MTSALSSVGEIVTQSVGIITGNEILMVLFCGGLLGVGFKAIRWAKKAVR